MIGAIAGVQQGTPDHEVTTPQGNFCLSPDVILVNVDDGSARLLDMTKSFHAVSAVGARMLQTTLAVGVDDAIPLLSQHYDVERQQIEADLTSFLSDLESQGLLRRHGQRLAVGDNGRLVTTFMSRIISTIHLLPTPATKTWLFLILARLSFPLFGWTRTVQVWRQAHAHFPSHKDGSADKEALRVLDRTVRSTASGHLVTMMCKERALCCWALARAAGFDAALVVGIALFPIAGHCWCQVGAATPGDDPDRIARFSPVGRW